ncbi:YhcN/YlaJ family sporulation lipoprotein [Bacillota bacterium Lsc_1132]
MKKAFIALALFSILTACSQTRNAQQNNHPQSINVKNSTIQEVDRKTGQEISKHLVELATSVPNVHDATAVVLGRYAIVGIDVNSKIDRSQVGSIKYSVAESLKKDPYGAKAIVIADPDTTQRLKEISAEIKKGRPIQGIMNELSDIAGRLMPEIPGDLITPNPKSGTEDQKKKLNQNEKQNLEHKQEKESNYQK